MNISRVEEMRNMDRQAMEKYGIIEDILMENAGQAAYFVILNECGIIKKKFVVCCGIGNNGGDGLVVARKLHSNGAKVTVLLLGDRSKFKGPAKLNLEMAIKINIEMIDIDDAQSARPFLEQADVIIDAIFGTGLDREVGGIYIDIIDLINQIRRTVVSLDIPSGIHGNTGQIMGAAVNADYTVTFGLPKIGNILYPGFDRGGKLYSTYISFPPALYNSTDLKIATNDPLPLPKRPRDAHKGMCGKVLFIAGSANYFGAPYFAALSFLKAGGGLSFLATPETVSPVIAACGHEIIFEPLKPMASGSISLENKQRLLEFSETVDMVVLGPGLSLNDETQTLVRELTALIKKPILIDGDGITAIAAHSECLTERKHETILTPHLGEMSRITKHSIDDIASDKINIIQATAQQLNSIIVLKGAHSLIGLPDKRVFVNLSGNPGMATAGSGDVLTGTIAAMYGLGLPIEEAVCTGVFIHGFAGDLAAGIKGEDGMIAGDVANQLPEAMKLFRTNYDSVIENCYHKICLI